MAKKIEKKEDVETPEVEIEDAKAPEVEKEEVEDAPESPEAEKPVVEKPAEGDEAEEVEEGEESEEAEEAEEKEAKADPEFEKLDAVNEKLEKMAKEKEVEDLSKANLEKGFEKIVTAVTKMSELIEGFDARLKKIESQPAPLKSKQAYVEVKKGEEPADKKVDENPEIAKKKVRLEELTKIYDSIGRSEFAKQGFSIEASKIQDEIVRLEA